jgi:hypothetical protein
VKKKRGGQEDVARQIAERQRHRDSLRPDLLVAERDLLDLVATVDAGEDEGAGALQ